MKQLHNHQQDTLYHADCPRCTLNSAAPELLDFAEFIAGIADLSMFDFDVIQRNARIVVKQATETGRASCGR